MRFRSFFVYYELLVLLAFCAFAADYHEAHDVEDIILVSTTDGFIHGLRSSKGSKYSHNMVFSVDSKTGPLFSGANLIRSNSNTDDGSVISIIPSSNGQLLIHSSNANGDSSLHETSLNIKELLRQQIVDAANPYPFYAAANGDIITARKLPSSSQSVFGIDLQTGLLFSRTVPGSAEDIVGRYHRGNDDRHNDGNGKRGGNADDNKANDSLHQPLLWFTRTDYSIVSLDRSGRVKLEVNYSTLDPFGSGFASQYSTPMPLVSASSFEQTKTGVTAGISSISLTSLECSPFSVSPRNAYLNSTIGDGQTPSAMHGNASMRFVYTTYTTSTTSTRGARIINKGSNRCNDGNRNKVLGVGGAGQDWDVLTGIANSYQSVSSSQSAVRTGGYDNGDNRNDGDVDNLVLRSVEIAHHGQQTGGATTDCVDDEEEEKGELEGGQMQSMPSSTVTVTATSKRFTGLAAPVAGAFVVQQQSQSQSTSSKHVGFPVELKHTSVNRHRSRDFHNFYHVTPLEIQYRVPTVLNSVAASAIVSDSLSSSSGVRFNDSERDSTAGVIGGFNEPPPLFCMDQHIMTGAVTSTKIIFPTLDNGTAGTDFNYEYMQLAGNLVDLNATVGLEALVASTDTKRHSSNSYVLLLNEELADSTGGTGSDGGGRYYALPVGASGGVSLHPSLPDSGQWYPDSSADNDHQPHSVTYTNPRRPYVQRKCSLRPPSSMEAGSVPVFVFENDSVNQYRRGTMSAVPDALPVPGVSVVPMPAPVPVSVLISATDDEYEETTATTAVTPTDSSPGATFVRPRSMFSDTDDFADTSPADPPAHLYPEYALRSTNAAKTVTASVPGSTQSRLSGGSEDKRNAEYSSPSDISPADPPAHRYYPQQGRRHFRFNHHYDVCDAHGFDYEPEDSLSYSVFSSSVSEGYRALLPADREACYDALTASAPEEETRTGKPASSDLGTGVGALGDCDGDGDGDNSDGMEGNYPAPNDVRGKGLVGPGLSGVARFDRGNSMASTATGSGASGDVGSELPVDQEKFWWWYWCAEEYIYDEDVNLCRENEFMVQYMAAAAEVQLDADMDGRVSDEQEQQENGILRFTNLQTHKPRDYHPGHYNAERSRLSHSRRQYVFDTVSTTDDNYYERMARESNRYYVVPSETLVRSRQKRLQLQQQQKLLFEYRYFQQQRENEITGRPLLTANTGTGFSNEFNMDEHGNIMVMPPPASDVGLSGRRRWATRRGWEGRGTVEPPVPLTFWDRIWANFQYAVSSVLTFVVFVLSAVGATMALSAVLYAMIVHRKWQKEQEIYVEEEAKAAAEMVVDDEISVTVATSTSDPASASAPSATPFSAAWLSAQMQKLYYRLLDEVAIDYVVRRLLPRLLPEALIVSLNDVLLPGYKRAREKEAAAALMEAENSLSEAMVNASQPVSQVEGVLEISQTLQMFTTAGDIIGYGSHGTVVYRGLYRNRYPVAIKRMLGHYQAFASREINTLIELSSDDGHPNIVKYFDTSVTVGGSRNSGGSSVAGADGSQDSGGFVYLALQLCHMSLKDFITKLQQERKERWRLKAAEVAVDAAVSSDAECSAEVYMAINPAIKAALMQMAEGINHLHSKFSIIHRDIKPGNILLLLNNSTNVLTSRSRSNSAASVHSAKSTGKGEMEEPTFKEEDSLTTESTVVDVSKSRALEESRAPMDGDAVGTETDMDDMEEDTDIASVCEQQWSLDMISRYTIKISDMGLSKQLSASDYDEASSLDLSSIVFNKSDPVLSAPSPSKPGGPPPTTSLMGQGTHDMSVVGTTGWQAPELLLLKYNKQQSVLSTFPTSSGACSLRTIDEHSEAMAGDVVDSADGVTNSNGDGDASVTGSLVSRSTGGKGSISVSTTATTTAYDYYSAADIFSLGCVFYYFIMQGEHPFGDGYEREFNIINGRNRLRTLLESDSSFSANASSSSAGGSTASVGSFRAIGNLDDSNSVSRANLIHMKTYFPDCFDLLFRMLAHNNNSNPVPVSLLTTHPMYASCRRPTIQQVMKHPFFWPTSLRLQFLVEFSDLLEHYVSFLNSVSSGTGTGTGTGSIASSGGLAADSSIGTGTACMHLGQILLALENNASDMVTENWIREIHPSLLEDVNKHGQKHRKYDSSSVRDCIRLLRNKSSHFHELNKDCRDVLLASSVAWAAKNSVVSPGSGTGVKGIGTDIGAGTGTGSLSASSSTVGTAIDPTGTDVVSSLHLMQYFEVKFPSLLMHCVVLACTYVPPSAVVFSKYCAPIAELFRIEKLAAPAPTLTPSVSIPVSIANVADGTGVTMANSAENTGSTLAAPVAVDGMPSTATPTESTVPVVSLDIPAINSKVIYWYGSTLASGITSPTGVACKGWLRHYSTWVQPFGHSATTGASMPVGVSVSGKEYTNHLRKCIADSPKRADIDAGSTGHSGTHYRSQLCMHWEKSKGTNCPMRKRGRCDYAHGRMELRSRPMTMISSGVTPLPSAAPTPAPAPTSVPSSSSASPGMKGAAMFPRGPLGIGGPVGYGYVDPSYGGGYVYGDGGGERAHTTTRSKRQPVGGYGHGAPGMYGNPGLARSFQSSVSPSMGMSSSYNPYAAEYIPGGPPPVPESPTPLSVRVPVSVPASVVSVTAGIHPTRTGDSIGDKGDNNNNAK